MAPRPDPRRQKVAKASNAVMLRLLDLAEQTWVSARDIMRIREEAELKISGIEAEIYLLRELAEISRSLPPRVFKEIEQRQRLIDAAQDALDDAIRREEEMLDAEEGAA